MKINNKTPRTGKTKKASKLSLNALFKNNKFLIAFSFFLACVLWLFFSQNSGMESTASIADIPISIQLSDEAKADGLVIFSGGDTKATVQISGNRLTLGSVTKEDIQVAAQQAASTILTPNTYSLELTAKNNSVKSFKIESVTPQLVSVYVDRYRERTFNLEDKIEYNYKVDSTYYAGSPVYSTEKITLSGPQTEVIKVDHVAVVGKIDGDLKSSYKDDFRIALYDSTGGEIKNELITASAESVSVTVPVLPKKELPLKATFTNAPAGFNTDAFATINPAYLTVAGPEATLNKLEEIKLQPIDFLGISPSNTTFNLAVDVPNDCRNISNITEVTVKLDLSGYSSVRQTVNKFTFKNLQDGYTAVATTSSLDVTIVGPDDVVDSLTASDIDAVIDLSSMGKDFVGSTEVAVSISVKGGNKCWAYSTSKYTANISVSLKE